MNFVKPFLGVLMVLAIVFATPVGILAEQIDAGFSVKAVIPENQRDTQAAYFDLMVSPGQQQILMLLAENPNPYEITCTVEAVTASTNRNGVIQYAEHGIWKDTLPVSFAEIAQVKESIIIIPPYDTVEIEVFLELPEEAFKGTLLGAVRVVKELDEEEQKQQTGIVNQFSYIVAVRLTEEEAGSIEAEFELDTVETELVNHKAAIVVNIVNTQPVIVRGASAKVSIFESGKETPVIEKWLEQVDIAPDSIFPMTLIDQEGYGFQPGDYTAQASVTYQDSIWSFEQDFVIEKAQAAALNDSAVNQVQHQQQVNDLPAAGIVLGSVSVLAAAVVTYFRLKCAKRNA